MGAAESRGGRNEDKRTSRRENKDAFTAAIERMRARQVVEAPAVLPPGAAESGLHVCVRKRPLFEHEVARGDFDAVTCTGPSSVVAHDARMRPDLHSMYLRHSTFSFDRVFSEQADNDNLYTGTAGPLVRRSVEGGIATLFMFGQTGSGKTYTMSAIHERACREIFELVAGEPALSVFLTYVELAGDRCKDMLNEAAPVKMLTDAEGEVQLRGVVEAQVTGSDELHALIIAAGKMRATAATGVHDQSSRSHALCRVILRHADGGDAVHGSFTMVDLAGTERNQDSAHHDAKLRKETTEINRSLMALKDCVRERAQGASHISFRKDKLTQLLRS
jgi:kinesin family protein 2/24